MKESITKFDLEAAFKALDDIDIPVARGVKANKPALTEIFSRKSKFDALMEEYYDVGNMADLDDAKDAREAEVAQAKLARIEKIVDLDAESPEDLLPSYVGKFIMQCPQCMTLFYKDAEDVEASEEDPDTVNVNEVCQHCGNESGYTLIGKVGEVTQEEAAEYHEEEAVDVTSTEEDEEELPAVDDAPAEESDEDLDIDLELDELDLDIEEAEEEKTEESFAVRGGEALVEDLQEEVSANIVHEVQKLVNDLLGDDKQATKDVINTVIDAIPDEELDNVINEVRSSISAAKPSKADIDELEKAAGETIPEDADTIGKILDCLDVFEWAKKSPELLKSVLSIGMSIIGALEPSFAAESVSAIISALPAETVAKVAATLNLIGNPMGAAVHGVNQLYKRSKREELTENAEELDVSADEFENLISSPEFKKPISDNEARAMMAELEGEKEDVKESVTVDEEPLEESVKVNNETLRYAVINPDGSFAGVPCTSEEEARELAAQKEGRIIVELGAIVESCAVKEACSDEEPLEEGIFDKVKDKVTGIVDSKKLKSRGEKANWVLANAMKNYNDVKADTSGKLVPDENNQRFKTFVIAGFADKYSNGKEITMAPSFNNNDLVISKVHEKESYADADNLAKGWSMIQGNGPAFIYLAESKNDPEAVFLCEYFKGELKNDQLEKYFNVVKDHLKGAELLANAGGNTSDEPEEAEYRGKFLKDNLAAIMTGIEELQEADLEKFISNSLVESYGNVAGFRLTECVYADNKLNVDGTIYFTSGNTRKTTYVFSEALTTEDGKVSIRGLNEKLGNDRQFTITGYANDHKFITESFKATKK